MIAHDYSVFNDRAAVEVEFGGVGSAAASFRVATSAHAATTTAVPPALGVTTGAVVVTVADWDNHRVQVLTPAGAVVRILGEDGTPGGSDLGDLHEAHPCGLPINVLMTRHGNSCIIHLDVDNFYVAVERVDNPALVGVPVVVEQDNAGGFVAVSNEAKAAGLRKGDGVGAQGRHHIRSLREMQSVGIAEAKRRCPGLVVLPMRMERYREVGQAILEVLEQGWPRAPIEKTSFDDFYADVTSYCDLAHTAPPSPSMPSSSSGDNRSALPSGARVWTRSHGAGSASHSGIQQHQQDHHQDHCQERQRRVCGGALGGATLESARRAARSADGLADELAAGARIAGAMRRAIAERLGLRASAGVGRSMLVARMLSPLAKPDGLLLIRDADVGRFMASRPLRTIPGLQAKKGKAIAAVLANRATRSSSGGGVLGALPPAIPLTPQPPLLQHSHRPSESSHEDAPTLLGDAMALGSAELARHLGPDVAALLERCAGGGDGERRVTPRGPPKVVSKGGSFPPMASPSKLQSTARALCSQLLKRLQDDREIWGNDRTRIVASSPAAVDPSITPSITSSSSSSSSNSPAVRPVRLVVTWRDGYSKEGETTKGVTFSRSETWPTSLSSLAARHSGKDTRRGDFAEDILASAVMRILLGATTAERQITRLYIGADFGHRDARQSRTAAASAPSIMSWFTGKPPPRRERRHEPTGGTADAPHGTRVTQSLLLSPPRHGGEILAPCKRSEDEYEDGGGGGSSSSSSSSSNSSSSSSSNSSSSSSSNSSSSCASFGPPPAPPPPTAEDVDLAVLAELPPELQAELRCQMAAERARRQGEGDRGAHRWKRSHLYLGGGGSPQQGAAARRRV